MECGFHSPRENKIEKVHVDINTKIQEIQKQLTHQKGKTNKFRRDLVLIII